MWHMFSMHVTSSLVDRRAEDGRLQHWLHAGPCLPLQSCVKLSYFLPSGFLSRWVETAQPTPTHAQDRRPRGACYVADTRAVACYALCDYVPTFIAFPLWRKEQGERGEIYL